MFGYVKAIRLHYRKKSDLNYTNTSEPIKFDPDVVHTMLNEGRQDLLHDYLLDVAIPHYHSDHDAEDYVNQHIAYGHHFPDQMVDRFTANLGNRTKPAGELSQGDVVSFGYRHPNAPVHHRPGDRYVVRNNSWGMGARSILNTEHSEDKIPVEFWESGLAPVIYHPPETPEQTQPQEPQQ